MRSRVKLPKRQYSPGPWNDSLGSGPRAALDLTSLKLAVRWSVYLPKDAIM
jgi:hypothetical protein